MHNCINSVTRTASLQLCWCLADTCSSDTARPSRATCEKGNTWLGLLGAPAGNWEVQEVLQTIRKTKIALSQIGRSWVLCPSTKSRKVRQGVCLLPSMELCKTQRVPRPGGSPPGVVPHKTSTSTQFTDFAGGMPFEDVWNILNRILNKNRWNDNSDMIWCPKSGLNVGKNETCDYRTNEGHAARKGARNSHQLTTYNIQIYGTSKAGQVTPISFWSNFAQTSQLSPQQYKCAECSGLTSPGSE